MSLKNLNAIKTPKDLILKLSNKRINKLFDTFEKNFNIQQTFTVAVSGGPDSLALAFLTKIYSICFLGDDSVFNMQGHLFSCLVLHR